MKSPYSYAVFDCEICVGCDVCLPLCPCRIIMYDLDYFCLYADKDSCMGCYCDAYCIQACPAEGAIKLVYEKPNNPSKPESTE